MSRAVGIEYSRLGAGRKTVLFNRLSKIVNMTMAGGVTVSDMIRLPAGAVLRGVNFEVPVAFSGSPTAMNLRVGTALAGAQVMADTDVKAQSHGTGTVVAAFDAVGSFAGVETDLYLQLAASGGTTPAGTVYVVFTILEFINVYFAMSDARVAHERFAGGIDGRQ